MLSCDGNVAQLKDQQKDWLKEECRNFLEQGKDFDVIQVNIKSSSVCTGSDEMLACASDASRAIYTVEVQSVA